MKIVTYNLNGIRSATQKGLIDYINHECADIYCFQETRATAEQVKQCLANIQGYYLTINESERKGYSGTAVLSKIVPNEVYTKLTNVNFDNEGRLQVLDFDKFKLINLYTPNGNSRLEYKMKFIDSLITDVDLIVAAGSELILCTDFNISHNELDLSHPNECANISGFLKQERELFDELLDVGLYDVYRELYPNRQRHTWSSYPSKRTHDKWGNLWTFDYIFVTKNILQQFRRCTIDFDALYSDHYPVTGEIDIEELIY